MKKKDFRRAVDALRDLSSRQNGSVSAKQLFEMAQNDPDSPFRPVFQWDQDKAFYAHNIDLARRFIVRAAKVHVVTETRQVSAVGYVRDPRVDSKEQGYLSVDAVRKDEDLKREVLTREFSRIGSCLKRARDLAHYFDLKDEFDVMERNLELMTTAVDESVAAN